MGEILDRFFVVVTLVIDAVLQPKFFYLAELFVGRRGSVHFYAEQPADLNCGSPHAACDRMNEDTMCATRPGSFRHRGLPVSQIRREVVDRESRSVFVGPVVRNRPQHVGVRRRPFGKGGPLSISHHPATAVFFHPGKLAANDHGRRRSSRVASLRGHHVGEVQASGADPHQSLAGFRIRIWGFFNGESFRSGQAGQD